MELVKHKIVHKMKVNITKTLYRNKCRCELNLYGSGYHPVVVYCEHGNKISGSTEGIIILPAVLYGCEAWCLTLREERRLKFSRIEC